jgi:hypothetical protein
MIGLTQIMIYMLAVYIVADLLVNKLYSPVHW